MISPIYISSQKNGFDEAISKAGNGPKSTQGQVVGTTADYGTTEVHQVSSIGANNG